ncbi:MAG TPA: dihydrolipoyl dehydrogenase [Rhodospirillaceae bacterium]|nr:MAG: dihydrolipoyl dehydrogenase [Alphaproteobacteria bacterium GWF2_58_20]HAU28715.1 dihydrolipoyl dehydrogenase [Rhodospirillaceae bacterium]
MSEKQTFDVVIIGGGPGGYVAAIRASQLGFKVALVEREHLGGVCLNWGCIPTKALLRSAEIYRTLQRLPEFGLSAEGVSADIGKIVERSRKIANQLAAGVKYLMGKNKVTVLDGSARLEDARNVVVEKNGAEIARLEAASIIIATGSRPRVFPGLETDGDRVWGAREAMTPKELPKTLLVIGSGSIGSEFSAFYSQMGTKVTLVEALDRILPMEDAEISSMARKHWEESGIEILTGIRVSALDRREDGVIVHISHSDREEERTFERVLVAVGVTGNIEDIGLENTKVEVEKGFIKTNGRQETAEAGIYAIGDVTGPPCLAHKASHEGVVAAEVIAGLDPHPVKPCCIPGFSYTNPQVASVGMTEAQARECRLDVRVGHFPFRANGKAIAMGELEGMVKTIFDAKTGELLGAHMLGLEVKELISVFALAKEMEATEEDFIRTVFPHPTLSETTHESVLDAFGRVMHV